MICHCGYLADHEHGEMESSADEDFGHKKGLDVTSFNASFVENISEKCAATSEGNSSNSGEEWNRSRSTAVGSASASGSREETIRGLT